jgi:hypothetical protein
MTVAACIRCGSFRRVDPDGHCARCVIAANKMLTLDERQERLEQHRRHRAEVEASKQKHPSNGAP